MAWGDCDTCLHDEDMNYCEECEHHERDTYDHYEEASPEVIAKREEEARQRSIEAAISEWIECEIPDEFKQMLEKAQKCASPEHFRKALMCVHAAVDGHLISSNGHILLELPCDVIPEPLKGRNIVKIEERRAAIHNDAYPNYNEIFKQCSSHTAANYEEFSKEEYEGADKDMFSRYYKSAVRLGNSSNRFLLDNKYLEIMREILIGQIAIYHSNSNPHAPLLFIGDNGRMVIMPLRKWGM